MKKKKSKSFLYSTWFKSRDNPYWSEQHTNRSREEAKRLAHYHNKYYGYQGSKAIVLLKGKKPKGKWI